MTYKEARAILPLEHICDEFARQKALEALDRQIPKKPDFEGVEYDYLGDIIYDTWVCPCCEERYEVDYDNYKYCPNCGQALDWSDTE